MASLYVNDYRPWPDWVVAGNEEIAARFHTQIGTYHGHADKDPDHDMSGDKAADFWLFDNSKDHHNDVLNWFVRDNFANARRIGATYIITWRRIASVARADEGIRDYAGSDPHTDHIHVSYGNTPPPNSEEEDMPTAKEIAEELATNEAFKKALAIATWQTDGSVHNVGFAPGTAGRFVDADTAVKAIMERILGLPDRVDQKLQDDVAALAADIALIKQHLQIP